MQLAVEIERVRLALGGADAVPKRADLLDRDRAGGATSRA